MGGGTRSLAWVISTYIQTLPGLSESPERGASGPALLESQLRLQEHRPTEDEPFPSSFLSHPDSYTGFR